MKAAVITRPGLVEVQNIPDPTPGPHEVVIAVASCGLCGTDLHILEGEFADTFPIVPGHEFAGEVVALGSDVRDLKLGDQVAVNPSFICYECRYCRKGLTNLCEIAGGYGTSLNGGAAEFAVVGSKYCIKLPEHVRAIDASLIEPLSCAIRGYDVIRRQMGSHVLIYGAGTMGLMMMELAKRAGAATVSMVDLNEDKLAAANTLGCDATVTSANELDYPYGWELVVDATGNQHAIQDGLGRVDRGGTFLQFGVASYATRATIEPYKIFRNEITIQGSMATLNSFERAADLFAAGVLDPEVFISDRLPLDQYPEAIKLFQAGKGRKIQVVP
ncbi:zinc-dependent alcohol dehydrogenase family protein [Lysinibacter cavernae]|uniref:2-desacetyl-2-hydroxyethyl bacteriochlorophyllide A dehydrogenase n=1 Tax=Lysinibacter cavernae TaxID=1640652 RepID=A0A7X5TS70_9MICO|nr:zinc-dependent alcohol dehydrogenase family protein [Lysinibacter cavernae]NIH53151.1 2-desacetyl-2-hydroxyethyl bacteriochlorophyllide A dehydrogenase [Lysinibacter cavernae]